MSSRTVHPQQLHVRELPGLRAGPPKQRQRRGGPGRLEAAATAAGDRGVPQSHQAATHPGGCGGGVKRPDDLPRKNPE